MKILSSVSEAVAQARGSKARRVLVPTMGALHEGHLELMGKARANAGRDGEVIVSIFVNPLQFEPGADLEKYPRPEKADEDFCRAAEVDVLFRPTASQMYSPDRSVFVEETSLSNTLCGRSRPGHFRGVCTVVAKLFHIVSPDAAVFGEKDFQQLAIIRRMVRDLDFPIEILGVPTVREKDGLAFSSRNRYLGADERKEADTLNKALHAAAALAAKGERPSHRLIEEATKVLQTAKRARIDYIELVDAENLQPLETVRPNSLLALAVFFGKTRLIDNLKVS